MTTGMGRLITFSGIDGAGKTTLAALLAEWLGTSGGLGPVRLDKLITSEGEFFHHLKALIDGEPDLDPHIQSSLFAFERYRTANVVLRPLLAEHDAIILDRYLYCDLAYNRARGLDVSLAYRLLKYVPTPDAAFVVDVPVELAMKRLADRGRPLWPFQENEPLLRATRTEFLRLAEELGLAVIDGSRPRERSLAAMVRVLRDKGVVAAAPNAKDGEELST